MDGTNILWNHESVLECGGKLPCLIVSAWKPRQNSRVEEDKDKFFICTVVVGMQASAHAAPPTRSHYEVPLRRSTSEKSQFDKHLRQAYAFAQSLQILSCHHRNNVACVVSVIFVVLSSRRMYFERCILITPLHIICHTFVLKLAATSNLEIHELK